MKRPDPDRVYLCLSFAVGFRIGVRPGRSGCETAAAGLPPLQRTGGGAARIRVGALRDALRRRDKLQLPFMIIGATPRQTSEFSENSEVYVGEFRRYRASIAAGSDNSYLVLTVFIGVCAIIFHYERRIERTPCS